jgi:hypothetical protein
MKKIKLLLASIIVCLSFNTNSSSNVESPGVGPYISFSYWQQCWVSVTGESFGPEATLTINKIGLEYSRNFAIPLVQAINEETQLRMNSASADNKSLIFTIVNNQEMMAAAKHKMEMSTLDSEMAFLENLAEAEIKNKHKGFFSDGNGEGGFLIKDSNSYKFAEVQCTRSKIMKSVASTESRKSNANNLSVATKEQETKNSKILSVDGFKSLLQKNHFEKYCSESEYEAALCEEQSEFPLGDLNATNFLFPSGIGSMDINEDGFFQTRYTYNQDEIEVSKDFITNIVFANPTRKPTISEQKNTSKAEFIVAYNGKYSALNLANYSFQMAHEKRIAKTTNKEGTPLSSYDLYRYQMENTLSSDAKLAVSNAKKKGVDFMVYSAMLVENNLELERLMQQERIEVLLAAINAAKINKSETINRLKSLK